MKLWQALLHEFRQDGQRPLTDATLLDVLGGSGVTDSGVQVTPDTAMRLTVVWRCISLLAGTMSGLPLHAYRRREDGGREPVDVPVLRRPHPDRTAVETWEYVFVSLLTYGNAFLAKDYDGLGRLRRLRPLHPGDFDVRVSDEYIDDINPSGKRFYRRGKPNEWYIPFEILHIPGLSLNGVTGLSPIEYAKQAVGLGVASEKYGARLYERGTLMQGFLTTPNEVDQEDADRAAARWRERTQGEAGWHKIPVLFGGLEFKPLQLSPRDALTIETSKMTVEGIARLYGVPLHLLAESAASSNWGTGVEVHGNQLLVFTMDPLLVKVEQRFSREVVNPSDPEAYARFLRAAILRPDTEKRYLAYQRAINNGWMSANEIRALEELDPVEGGDTYYVPANLKEAGIGDPSDPPTPAPEEEPEQVLVGQPPYELPEE
ncbi:MAG: phage portal protein [Actinomycetota bacterium]|nr:phage portal protein [Actinomycetota bacterium]